MPNPKRVSVKGMGADLFFEGKMPAAPEASALTTTTPTEEAPSSPAELLATEMPTEIPAVPSTQETASKQASLQTSTLNSKHVSKQASKPASIPASLAPGGFSEEAVSELAQRLAEPATILNSFRYTREELDTLAEVVYQLSRRWEPKLSKQDIARLGLEFILWDWNKRQNQSVLGMLAGKRKRKS
jgi:hypothetical protein